MKFIFGILLLAFAVVFVASVESYTGNGRPGCKTAEELSIGTFRNNWEPTAFWKCKTLNRAASLGYCPKNLVYMDSEKNCVAWSDWRWEEPVEPPSLPDEE